MINKENSNANPEDTFPTNDILTPCDNCQAVAPEFIELKCGHAFCLNCLAQYLLREGRISPKSELFCLKCNMITTLDENSIFALESAIQHLIIQQNFKNQILTKNRDLFREVIEEESRETFFTAEDLAMTGSLTNNTGDNIFNLQKLSGQGGFGVGSGDSTNLSSGGIPAKIFKELENSRCTQKYEVFKDEDDKNERKSRAVTGNSNGFSADSIGKQMATEGHGFSSQNYSQAEGTKKYSETCRYHPSERLNLFCLTCESTPFCVECLIEGKHQSHIVRNIEKCQEYLREKSEDLALIIKKQYDSYLHILSRSEEKMNTQKNQSKNVREYLAARFNEIYSEIAKKKAILLRENSKIREFSRFSLLKELEKLEKIRGLYNTRASDLDFGEDFKEADFHTLKKMYELIQKAHQALQNKEPAESSLESPNLARNLKFSNFLMNDSLLKQTINALKPIRFTNTFKNSENRLPVRSPNALKISSVERFNPECKNFAEYIEINKQKIKTDQKKTYLELKSKLEFLGLNKSKDRINLGSPLIDSSQQKRTRFETRTSYYKTLSSKIPTGGSSRKTSPDLAVTNLSKRWHFKVSVSSSVKGFSKKM